MDLPPKCARCGACCVAPDIAALDKPVGVRCEHLTAECLCAIYPSRPPICRAHRPDETCRAIEAPTLEERVRLYLERFGLTDEASRVRELGLRSMRQARRLPLMTPREAMELLAARAHFGMRFGLERMREALEALGHPERRFRVLHVAGTNGKGSTCAFAASMLERAGMRVGLYTSPHLERVTERVRVNGAEIGEEAFAEAVEAALGALPSERAQEDPLTFFELGTLIALWHFARERVDVAVLETGLGGRLDATNAVGSQVAAITRIALDHTALLGPDLATIAREKAGIFKPGSHLVLARQPSEALEVLRERALAAGGTTWVAGVDFALEGEGPFRFRGPGGEVADLVLSLQGPHQRENAEAAIAAVLALEPRLEQSAIREGLRQTRWPGRFETVRERPLVLLDGAHNPDGAEALARAMSLLYPGARTHLVFGVLADKDIEGITRALLPLAHRLYLASPRCERALPVEALAARCQAPGAPTRLFSSVSEALEAACAEAEGEAGALVLVAGSLYVVGEARAHLGGFAATERCA